MNTKPKISVVIPCFNEERYLPRCLASLKKQTFTDFEVIVVDNNCSDNTAEIAKTYGARVVKETVQGMIPARERGFSEARAEIIARTDADSILPPTWLDQIYQRFQNYPKIVALTGGFIFPEEKRAQNSVLQRFVDFYCMQMKLILGHYPLNGPNYALRKAAWEKIDAHKDDKLVHEDIDLSCHLHELGSIHYLRDVRVSYSLRRWKKKFWYTLYEYGLRNVRTVMLHKPKLKRYTKYISR
jgi:glycosyltransferase involved in cell wall biosynthesis